jgi:hypothetical protein
MARTTSRLIPARNLDGNIVGFLDDHAIDQAALGVRHSESELDRLGLTPCPDARYYMVRNGELKACDSLGDLPVWFDVSNNSWEFY